MRAWLGLLVSVRRVATTSERIDESVKSGGQAACVLACLAIGGGEFHVQATNSSEHDQWDLSQSSGSHPKSDGRARTREGGVGDESVGKRWYSVAGDENVEVLSRIELGY